MTSVDITPGETVSPTEPHTSIEGSKNNNNDNSGPSIGLRRLVRARALTTEQSLTSYLKFLGRRDDEPIFLQVIDPRETLRSSATAVATDIPMAIGLLQAADGYRSQGDYLFPNKVRKGVEHRYEIGRWAPDKKGEGLSDRDIAARRAVYIDADVVRDAGDGPVRGISASKEEAFTSMKVVGNIAALFASVLGDEDALGFGMSGNGGHLHIALEDLDPEASEPIVKELLAVTAAMFTTDTVKIDGSVTDAKRIAPAFGTVKRKGTNTKERPWRRTGFLSAAIDAGRPVRRLSMGELATLVDALKGRLTVVQRVSLDAAGKATTNTVTNNNNNAKDDIFRRANSLSYVDVMSRLGIPMTCPGCGETKDSNLYEPGNRWHCFRATCQPSSPRGSGNWSAIDAVAKHKGVKAKDAAKLICREFGVQLRGPGRPRKQLTFDDLIARAENLGVTLPGPKASGNEPSTSEAKSALCQLTDLGNAERLVARHGTDLHYVGLWQRWIVWDGTRWRKDDLGEVQRRAHDTVRGILGEALSADDDETRAAVAAWATQSESRGRIEAMISMAQSMVSIVPEQLNQHGGRLNCPNGTIDLRTGELQPHRRNDLLTTITRADFIKYNPFAAKTWEGFLRRVQPDPEVRAFLQRLIGASVLGGVREHLLPVHNGNGRNGKGTFFESLLFVLGEYATAVPEELLIESRTADHPTLLATLCGKRLAIASETKQGDALAMSRIKRLTGGDTISCRKMREDWWDFAPSHLLHLQTNHRPRVNDSGHAAWARLMLIEWAVTIPKEEQDKTLREKLQEEAPQILGWVVAGAIEYLREGLLVPESVMAATRKWRGEEDIIGQFLADCCLTWSAHGKHRLAQGKITDSTWYDSRKKELYEAYRAWALEAGLSPKGKIQFGKDLQERGFGEGRENGTNQHQWVGVGLADSVDSACRAADDATHDAEMFRMLELI